MIVGVSLLVPPLVNARPSRRTIIDPAASLESYRDDLKALRKEFGGVRELPLTRFFLFGMGQRRKMLYRGGALIDARNGEVIKRWDVGQETIIPPLYAVYLRTKDGVSVRLVEDEKGISLEEGKKRTVLSESPLKLPSFAGNKYASVLRVLHQEVLVNVVDGQPLPNFFVYRKP